MVTAFICENIGVAGTTPCHVEKTDDGYEMRMGIAVFGSTNLDEEGFKRCDYNPFHPEFHDNYVSGKGATEEEAAESLKQDMKQMAESLWY